MGTRVAAFLYCAMRSKRPDKLGGFSLLEAAFGASIAGIFFVALFGLSSQCLYFANASREVTTAGQTAQSRLEQLRNCTWAQITKSDGTYIAGTTTEHAVLYASVNGASNLGALTEVVTISPYPAPSPAQSPIQVTRASNGTVTVNSTNSTMTTNAEMVSIGLQLTWNSSPPARSRSISVSTVYAQNTR